MSLPVLLPTSEGERAPVWPPWLDGPLRSLRERRARIPHALLVHGPAGVGKSWLAQAFAADLLCETTRDDGAGPWAACGRCPGCRWFAAGAHPDLRRLLPEAMDPDHVPERGRKPSREIRIDAMRALGDFLNHTGHRGGWRVVLIEPADAMNVYAANALLKSLEEPGARTLLMLISSHPDRIMATIRSRCQAVAVAAPSTAEARAWMLAQPDVADDAVDRALAAAGAPLHALSGVEPARDAAHRSVLAAIAGLPDTALPAVVDAIAGVPEIDWTDLLQRWVNDLARVKAGSDARYFPQHRDRLERLAGRLPWQALIAQHDRLLEARAWRDHPLNPRLVCESLLLQYRDAFVG
ncbi:MAG: DNA polymerase III subunit delta' [Burkholderiaceae bacterium]